MECGLKEADRKVTVQASVSLMYPKLTLQNPYVVNHFVCVCVIVKLYTHSEKETVKKLCSLKSYLQT